MVFSEDEEYKRVSFDKFATLKPVFQKENGNPSYFILVIYLVKILARESVAPSSK